MVTKVPAIITAIATIDSIITVTLVSLQEGPRIEGPASGLLGHSSTSRGLERALGLSVFWFWNIWFWELQKHLIRIFLVLPLNNALWFKSNGGYDIKLEKKEN